MSDKTPETTLIVHRAPDGTITNWSKIGPNGLISHCHYHRRRDSALRHPDTPPDYDLTGVDLNSLPRGSSERLVYSPARVPDSPDDKRDR